MLSRPLFFRTHTRRCIGDEDVSVPPYFMTDLILQLTVIRSSGIASTNAMPCSEHATVLQSPVRAPRTMAAANIASDRRHLFTRVCVPYVTIFVGLFPNCHGEQQARGEHRYRPKVRRTNVFMG